jgi:hypothetical protein
MLHKVTGSNLASTVKKLFQMHLVKIDILKCLTNSGNHILYFYNLFVSLRFLLRKENNQKILKKTKLQIGLFSF